ncbi:MAG: IclR family transcriptional regulator [Eubacteriales bacterium]
MENTNSSKYNIKVLEKALRILGCFTIHKHKFSTKEFCDKLDLNRTTVYRIITILKKYKYLEEGNKTGKYRLGKAFVVNGAVLINQMDIKKKARPYLENLASNTGETASLCVYYDYTSLIIDSFEGTNDIKVHVPIGKRVDLHAASHGKMFLSTLSDCEINKYLDNKLPNYTSNTHTNKIRLWEIINQIRIEGIAYDFQEMTEGIIGITAPIIDYNNKIIAAISIAAPQYRAERNIKKIERSLKKYSLSISENGLHWKIIDIFYKVDVLDILPYLNLYFITGRFSPIFFPYGLKFHL